MITRKDIIRARGRIGASLTSTHIVKVTITGRADLDKFAEIMDAGGRHEMATHLRDAKRFSINMSAADAAAIFGKSK